MLLVPGQLALLRGAGPAGGLLWCADLPQTGAAGVHRGQTGTIGHMFTFNIRSVYGYILTLRYVQTYAYFIYVHIILPYTHPIFRYYITVLDTLLQDASFTGRILNIWSSSLSRRAKAQIIISGLLIIFALVALINLSTGFANHQHRTDDPDGNTFIVDHD